MTGDSVSEIIRVADVEVTLLDFEQYRPKTFKLAPEVGFEPTTNRLTADRSTTELLWNEFLPNGGNTVCPQNEEQQVVSKSAR